MGRGFFQRGKRGSSGLGPRLEGPEEGCSVPDCWVREAGGTVAIGYHVRRLCDFHRDLWWVMRDGLTVAEEDEAFADWIGE